MSCPEFFGETSNHSGDSVLLQLTFGALWLLAFPKIKITFEREEISDHQWDSGKYNRAAESDWENCVRSQGAYFEGDWSIIVLCTMFLVCSSVNASVFHITWLDTFWTDLLICRIVCINIYAMYYEIDWTAMPLPLKIHRLKPNPWGDGIKGWDFWELIRS